MSTPEQVPATHELRDEERTRCEIWTRVMGYHRPVAAWNPGKRAEHADRVYFNEPTAADDRQRDRKTA
jgi:hypothetical protein